MGQLFHLCKSFGLMYVFVPVWGDDCIDEYCSFAHCSFALAHCVGVHGSMERDTAGKGNIQCAECWNNQRKGIQYENHYL